MNSFHTIHDYIDYLVSWLEEKRMNFYHAESYVLGLSGGIDSAVVLALLAKTGIVVRPFMLPTDVNQKSDIGDAMQLLAQFKLSGEVISIQPMYDSVMNQVKKSINASPDRVNVLKGNVMARLRMTTLYTIAQSYNSVVVGTDNKAEMYTGYFTKFGDGAADLFPLAHLRKEQVYELARVLNIPESIINKKPSAGLWEGQTDEGEMGVTYAEIDAFLRGEKVSKEAEERIAFWHDRSHHKRVLPLIPDLSI